MYQWDFTPVLANADILAAGLGNTLKLTGTALAFGIPLGLALVAIGFVLLLTARLRDIRR